MKMNKPLFSRTGIDIQNKGIRVRLLGVALATKGALENEVFDFQSIIQK